MTAWVLWFCAFGVPLAVALGWLAQRAALGRPWPWPGLAVGAGAFVVSGVLQNAMVAPVALALHAPDRLVPLIPASAGEALYYGFAAGVAQELLKLAGLAWFGRRRGFLGAALAVGAGFAATEVAFVGISALAGQASVAPGWGALAMPLWERGSATVFHLATAGLLALGLARGRVLPFLGLAVLLHGALDGAVELLAMAEGGVADAFGPAAHVARAAVFESIFSVYALAVAAFALLRLRAAELDLWG